MKSGSRATWWSCTTDSAIIGITPTIDCTRTGTVEPSGRRMMSTNSRSSASHMPVAVMALAMLAKCSANFTAMSS